MGNTGGGRDQTGHAVARCEEALARRVGRIIGRSIVAAALRSAGKTLETLSAEEYLAFQDACLASAGVFLDDNELSDLRLALKEIP